jgi:MEMO1 family protein
MKSRFIPLTGIRRRRFRILLIIGAAGLIFCLLPAVRSVAAADVRPSILAGTWYPGNKNELRSDVRDMIDRARPDAPAGRLVALAVPHAGYMYSGPVAAYAFKLLIDRDIDTIVLIGPSHRHAFSGVAIDLRDYETPIGNVEVDRELAAGLIQGNQHLITTRTDVHEQEHSLEIEMPFIQTVLPHARIVPVLMGSQDEQTCRTLAALLTDVLAGKNVILVVSTDLSHFHNGPDAEAMDDRLLKHVEAFNPERLYFDLRSGSVEACGGGPLTVVMTVARSLGANQARVLKYAHSGHVTGDHSRVVGYMAAAFVQTDPVDENSASGRTLTDEQVRLLKMARKAIMAALEHREFTPPPNPTGDPKPHRGAFVTLKKAGQLRGCIGRVVSDRPLAETVSHMAVQAAFHDPRFPPLSIEEYDDLELEISVLSPVEPVTDPESIQIGRHGLIMVKGGRQGLLLPQVPLEQGWDRLEFLNQTCLKAGLTRECWQDGADIYAFSADVFGEKDLPSQAH